MKYEMKWIEERRGVIRAKDLDEAWAMTDNITIEGDIMTIRNIRIRKLGD